MSSMHPLRKSLVLGGVCALLASCSWDPAAHQSTRHQHLAGRPGGSREQNHNPPEIEYLLVLDSNGKPRTSFHAGASVRVRLEVYSVAPDLGTVRTNWQIDRAGHTVRRWSLVGGFTGPTRGNLFRLTQSDQPAPNVGSGTYSVTARLAVQGATLSRSAQFFVRR
jgi:hypothetical protein